MAKKTLLGSIKRFGPRYGARNKLKVAMLEKEHRSLHKCPYCSYIKVKRLSAGIWKCKHCNSTFTGKAYTFNVSKGAVTGENESINNLKKSSRINNSSDRGSDEVESAEITDLNEESEQFDEDISYEDSVEESEEKEESEEDEVR